MEPITGYWELYLTSPGVSVQPNCSFMYGPIPDISPILRERRMRFAGHCWPAKQELASDLLLWSPNHGKRRVGRPAITYIDQLCRDTGCLPNDLPALVQDRNGWRDKLMNARASSTWRWCLGRSAKSYNTDEIIAVLSNKSFCKEDWKGKRDIS